MLPFLIQESSDTGDYEVNKAFDGMQALFMLPLDKSKADDKAAEKYFTQIDA